MVQGGKEMKKVTFRHFDMSEEMAWKAGIMVDDDFEDVESVTHDYEFGYFRGVISRWEKAE